MNLTRAWRLRAVEVEVEVLIGAVEAAAAAAIDLGEAVVAAVRTWLRIVITRLCCWPGCCYCCWSLAGKFLWRAASPGERVLGRARKGERWGERGGGNKAKKKGRQSGEQRKKARDVNARE